jgi:hypothetical protein
VRDELARGRGMRATAKLVEMIDTETANKLYLFGTQDAQPCWDLQSKCSGESAKRAGDKILGAKASINASRRATEEDEEWLISRPKLLLAVA